MRSFEHRYLLETPISHTFVAAMRAVGEFRGRQGLVPARVSHHHAEVHGPVGAAIQ
ncbi:MAG: hypothetical protein V2A79_17455 [Planctomycetota bacterium]